MWLSLLGTESWGGGRGRRSAGSGEDRFPSWRCGEVGDQVDDIDAALPLAGYAVAG
jgi:hypothetical protein